MKILALISALMLALSLVLGGGAPFGRLLIATGLPGPAGLATGLFRDPAWQGVALFRAQQFPAAAEAFASAGHTYNQGNALVYQGAYAAALEAYDVALSGGHQTAKANFDLVAAFYAGQGLDPASLGLVPQRKDGPTQDSFVARGDARAAGTGDEVTNANTMLGLAELDSRGRLGVRRIFDETFMVADERWLHQLSDVPGAFLKARIAAEHKRRQAAGVSPPAPGDPR